MAKPNKNITDTATLQGRLAFCIANAGGKKVVSLATGISEAQLFRYTNTIADMPVSKLVAISEAAGVAPMWLLTGEVSHAPETPQPPAFRPALMQYVSRMLDEFLVEYQKPIPPRLKSGLLTLIYEALRHEEVLSGEETLPNKFQLIVILNFMTALRTEEEIDLYRDAMRVMEYERSSIAAQRLMLKSFCGLLVRCCKHYYDSFAGEAYYERVGLTLNPLSQRDIQTVIDMALKTASHADLAVLDIGCGNGRNLFYIHQQYPKILLHGIDASQKAIDSCQSLIDSEKLPHNVVRTGDALALPYPNSSMDVVISNYSLHYQPYLPELGLGSDIAWSEITRVLKPGGLAWITLPVGEGRVYSLFCELMSPEAIEQLALQHGLKVQRIETHDYTPKDTNQTVQAYIPYHLRRGISLILKKAG